MAHQIDIETARENYLVTSRNTPSGIRNKELAYFRFSFYTTGEKHMSLSWHFSPECLDACQPPTCCGVEIHRCLSPQGPRSEKSASQGG